VLYDNFTEEDRLQFEAWFPMARMYWVESVRGYDLPMYNFAFIGWLARGKANEQAAAN